MEGKRDPLAAAHSAPDGVSLEAGGGGPASRSRDFWLVGAAMLPAVLVLGDLVYRLSWIWSERPEMQFGWIVLMLVGYLFTERWADRPRVALRFHWSLVVAVVMSIAALMVVQVVQAVLGLSSTLLYLHAGASFLLAFACLGYAFGPKGPGHFLFPLLFLLTAVPLPSFVQGPIVSGLQTAIAATNVELLNLLGVSARRVGSLIHLAQGAVGVDEACSGIRSLQSSVMATMFIGYLSLQSNFLRCLLFVGGVGFAVVGNVFRSLYLSWIADSRGVSAVAAVHDSAGWSILVFTAAGVGFFAWSLARVERAARAEEASLGG